MRSGDDDQLSRASATAREVCASLDDPSLAPLVRLAEAVDALRRRRVDDGCALIAVAIPAVESGEVSQDWAGDFYGLLLYAGRTFADAARMQEWTESLARWCDAHNAMVQRRVLHVYRTQSEHELLTESRALDGVHALAAGVGFRRIGELRRARGDDEGARAAFATARRLGVG